MISYNLFYDVLVPFDIGVVYITSDVSFTTEYGFSPLRYWGGLYQYINPTPLDNCFSPLRYWGGLYQIILLLITTYIVLVPFDIGVVYIRYAKSLNIIESFSPLRYWGGLYLPLSELASSLWVLVPFDIGVVYISSASILSTLFCFSPLRYWGGLYPIICF